MVAPIIWFGSGIMDKPKTMKAVVLVGHGDFEKLVYEEAWPAPEIGATDVLIKVAACGLNNTDVNTRSVGIQRL